MHYLLIALGIVQLFGANVAMLYLVHMFQLHSYKVKAQNAWCGKNASRLLLFFVPLAGGFFFWPRKTAKKPLKFTPRVVRLLAAIGVLEIVLLFPGIYHLSPWYVLADAFCITGLAEWILFLANLINKPMETAICNRYTKQAKRLLAEHPNLLVIGITGSFGKTSVKHFLTTLLRAKYNVLMTPGGVNTPMGVVRCVREELNASHEIFVCEMGAKQSGDIAELCDIAHPTHGVLTSIGPQHLETFLTLENVIQTKLELARALPTTGILFANSEDENIAERLGDFSSVVAYAASENGAAYGAKDIFADAHGTTFTVITPEGDLTLTTRLLGKQNVVNLVGAIAVAHTLGVPLSDIKGRTRKIEPVKHRLELLDKGGGLLVIDDAYNSNPTGAKAALDALALFDGCKVLVTPGMIELGTKQEELNFIFGQQAAAVCDYVILVGEAQTKPIKEGLQAAGFSSERLIAADSLREAIPKVEQIHAEGRKIVLYENDLPDNF
ncbi:MAG: UDP-N-acetylmuramoyl-tripeptide--D-alanyl-D-alanine ligase [Oscillospiraceae bacterium]|nr:UDP-N-acetylmuramoyl-tripeptide--D-alanyl-D-alanine ligase [Oscillospiraceae bacterium]